jgi:adenosylmethionine-8-amino-7-oxononanoate aminotransferase
MVGIEIVADRAQKKGFAAELKTAAKIALAAREEGVLVRALPNSDVIALSPPFCATQSSRRSSPASTKRSASLLRSIKRMDTSKAIHRPFGNSRDYYLNPTI